MSVRKKVPVSLEIANEHHMLRPGEGNYNKRNHDIKVEKGDVNLAVSRNDQM